MIPRPQYVQKLLSLRDKRVIKVITGVRRSGKSTLFALFQEHLLSSGVSREQILSLNLEDPAHRELAVWDRLYDHIHARLLPGKKNYVFIDEVQNVADFQRAADGLFIQENVDLYLTGSNSRVQSGEWATMLAGRYVTIRMLPLSFKEYVSAVGQDNLSQKFQKYLEFGAFPQCLEFSAPDDVKSYLASICDTILLKDVAEGGNFRDISRLERIVRFMADNIGKETSVNNIAETITKDSAKMNVRTVEKYLKALCDSYILYRADRYDIRGKKLLKTLNKYYMVDTGLRYALLGDRLTDTGRMLENIVYLELLRRGYKVYVGKVAEKEVDFVAEGIEGTEYFQVAETVHGEQALARELSPLSMIRDHHPKFLLTRDYNPKVSHNGVKQRNVLEWLLE